MNNFWTVTALLFLSAGTSKSAQLTLKELLSQLAITDFAKCHVRLVIPTLKRHLAGEDFEIFQEISGQRDVTLATFNLSSRLFHNYRVLVSRRGGSCALNIAFIAKRFGTTGLSTLLQGIGVRSRDYYVIVASSLDLPMVKQQLQNLRARYTIIVTPMTANGGGFSATNLCSYCNEMTALETHSLSESSKSTGSRLFFDFTKNLWGQSIRLFTLHSDPDMEIVEDGTGGHRLKRGFHVDLLNFMGNMYNFTYYITEIAGKGKKPPEEMLEQDLADIAIACSPTPGRIVRFDMTSAIFFDKINFISAMPKAGLSWDTILGGLGGEMYLIIASVPVAFITIYLILRFKTIVGMLEKETWTRGTIMYFAFKSLTHEDHRSIVKDHTLRCFLCSWLLYNVVISVVYESKLISALMRPTTDTIPDTFEQLAERQDFHIVFNTFYGYAHRMLSTSTNPVYSTIFDRSELEPNSSSCLLRAILTPKTVCLGYMSTAIFYAETRKELSSKFAVSSGNIFLAGATWMMRKDSLLTDNVNKVISSMVSMGLVHKCIEMDFAQVRLNNSKTTDRVKGPAGKEEKEKLELVLSLEQLTVVVLCAVGGLAVSVIAWICEIVTAWFLKVELWATVKTSILPEGARVAKEQDSYSLLSI